MKCKVLFIVTNLISYHGNIHMKIYLTKKETQHIELINSQNDHKG